jgi:hypothetical protein
MKQPVYSFGSASPRNFAGNAEVSTYPIQYPFINTLKKRILSRIDQAAGAILRVFPVSPPAPEKAQSVEMNWSRSYTSFGPVDMKVYLDDQSIFETQGLSINDNSQPGLNLHGELKTVMFDRSIRDKIELGREYTLTLLAADEWGKCARATVFGVKFERHHWSVNIDDIVTEELLAFSARKMIPLRIVDSTRDEDGEIIFDQEDGEECEESTKPSDNEHQESN